MSSGGLCIAVFSFSLPIPKFFVGVNVRSRRALGMQTIIFPSSLTKTNAVIATCIPFGECDNYIGP
jgi:hypothetical protein